jgi:N-acetylgalactosamine-6-sulfatase
MKIRRYFPVLLTIALTALLSLPTHGAASADRPNIIFILADDLGYGDIGCYGREDIETPNLDNLASQGVRFTQHYANAPECSPTRAVFMTGRYQQWIGGLECAIGTGNVGRYDDAIRLAHANDLGLPTSIPTLPRMLKEAGYATALSGKWHLGYEPKFQPNLHGFDQSYYCIAGGMDYFHYTDNKAGYNLFRDGNPVSGEGYFTDLATDEAIGFIERNTEKPFFLWLAYTAPHFPFQGPDDLLPDPLPLDSPLWNQETAPPDVYVSMIERMDQQIGRLLARLDALGLAENTVVVFASDHGGTRSARNAPFSGHKGSTQEGGIRSPLIIRWPGALAEGVESDQPCITFDLTKSFARMAGVPETQHAHFEGMDIIQHVAEGKPEVARTFYWRQQRGDLVWKAVRDGDLKYYAEFDGTEEKASLYDLKADVAEAHDLRDSMPEQFGRLQGLYNTWEHTTRENRRGKPEE